MCRYNAGAPDGARVSFHDLYRTHRGVRASFTTLRQFIARDPAEPDAPARARRAVDRVEDDDVGLPFTRGRLRLAARADAGNEVIELSGELVVNPVAARAM